MPQRNGNAVIFLPLCVAAFSGYGSRYMEKSSALWYDERCDNCFAMESEEIILLTHW